MEIFGSVMCSLYDLFLCFRIGEFFVKTVPFQLVNERLIDESRKIQFAFNLGGLTHEIEGVGATVAIDARRQRKIRAVKLVRLVENG